MFYGSVYIYILLGGLFSRKKERIIAIGLFEERILSNVDGWKVQLSMVKIS